MTNATACYLLPATRSVSDCACRTHDPGHRWQPCHAPTTVQTRCIHDTRSGFSSFVPAIPAFRNDTLYSIFNPTHDTFTQSNSRLLMHHDICWTYISTVPMVKHATRLPTEAITIRADRHLYPREHAPGPTVVFGYLVS